MSRWVVYAESLDDVDMSELNEYLLGEIAEDAQRIVNGQSRRTGRLETAVHVEGVTSKGGYVVANPRNPRSAPEDAGYAYWVEKGTSDTPAEPFLRPATYIYRTP